MLTSGKSSLANFSQAGLVFVAGKVAIGATGAVGTKTGKGFTVTRTGAGLYTVTFDGSGGFTAILFADIQISPAAANATQEAFVLTHAPSTRTLTIQTNASGTRNVAADPPSGSVLALFAVLSTQ
jgi:hypothetical protein